MGGGGGGGGGGVESGFLRYIYLASSAGHSPRPLRRGPLYLFARPNFSPPESYL